MDNTIDFKLPIYYVESKNKLDDSIIDDLELVKTKDLSGLSLYDNLLTTDNFIGNKTSHMWCEHYSYDQLYLENTQSLIQNFKTFECDNDCLKNSLNNWDMIHKDDVFIDRYQYIDLPYVRKYNNSTTVLHFYSLYNLSSPVISLITPIFGLIVPFFILKLQGISITFQGYQDILIKMIKNSTLGRLFTDFSTRSWNQQLSLLVSAGFYLFGIYQNIIACYKFYININKITNTFKNIKNFIEYTNEKIKDYVSISNNLIKYQLFNQKLIEHQTKLNKYYNNLITVNTDCITLFKIKQIGCIMKYFYDLKYDIDLVSSINYMFYFHGYLDNIQSLKNKITNKQISFCEYTDKPTKFKNSYYGILDNKKVVKNSYQFKKHHIITGPNAAGKTTLLKSTLFNIILSQQTGCGFYDKANINMYHYIHCYLNIPDTSGRDSLFQAEARRCKEILDKINKSSNKRHFCIFDELYSGTNPTDAVDSAYSFLSYLTKFKNINFILTTHYVDLCERLSTNKKIENKNMKIIKENNDIIYTYKLTKGICKIKGGNKILKDLGYPEEIVSNNT
jgi:hypothetical protein